MKLCRMLFSLNLIVSTFNLSASGQNQAMPMPYQNNTTYLQTVLLQRPDLPLALATIKLGSNDQLVLRFDDLRSGVRDYQYTVLHCNQDWTPSGLFPMDYLNGFEVQFINDYSFSFNTRQGYTQYRSVFPNADLEFKVSGNYLLKVYETGIDSAVLVIPFYVWEDLSAIEANIVRPALSSARDELQRLMMEIDIKEVPTSNPYDEIRVSVMQNYNLHTVMGNLKPRIIQGNKLIYDQTDLFFPGMKEFRRFDTRNLRVQSERVRLIERSQQGFQVYINQDDNRSYKRYVFDNDINGRFIIGADLTNDIHLQADYAMVHFSLESPFWIADGDFYVVGSFNQFQMNTDNKMIYNADLQQYEKAIYLKQGYYNYLYAFSFNEKKDTDYSMAEGHYFETMNDYTVFVYLRDNLRQADRLVGFHQATSFPR